MSLMLMQRCLRAMQAASQHIRTHVPRSTRACDAEDHRRVRRHRKRRNKARRQPLRGPSRHEEQAVRVTMKIVWNVTEEAVAL